LNTNNAKECTTNDKNLNKDKSQIIILHNARQVITCKGDKPKRAAHLRDIAMELNSSIVIEKSTIKEIGPSANIMARYKDQIKNGTAEFIDMTGSVILPGFVDPHTHALFTGTRENEFQMRIEGKAYVDILLEGGGILSTVNKVRKSSSDELIEATMPRIDRMLDYGTTTCEIKSGYGLNTESEIKMLKAIATLEKQTPMSIVPTFMGAHAVPPEFRNRLNDFTDYLVSEMLPAVAEQKLSKYCDIFSEKKVFPCEPTRKILEKAVELGFKPKIHADEIDPIGALNIGVELGAISAEHLIMTTEEGIDILAKSDTIACLLPGTAFSLMHGKYAPARQMIDKKVAVAIATDCNPGSCYTESMQAVISIACTQMGMVPAEAINAATINAAFAIGMEKEVGSLEPGKKADIIAMSIPDYKYIPYHFGINHVNFVMKHGEIIKNTSYNVKTN